MHLVSKLPLLMFRSHSQRSGSKLLVFVQMLSAQYLLTTLLENRQALYSGCPLRVDVPYWCSDHMVKGQGQTVCLNPKCCLLNILWVKLWIKVKLSTGNHRNAVSQLVVAYLVIKRLWLGSNLLNHQLILHCIYMQPILHPWGIYACQTLLLDYFFTAHFVKWCK